MKYIGSCFKERVFILAWIAVNSFMIGDLDLIWLKVYKSINEQVMLILTKLGIPRIIETVCNYIHPII